MLLHNVQSLIQAFMRKYFYETVGQLHGTLAQVFKDSLIVRAPYENLFFFRRNKSIDKENVDLGQLAITQCSIIDQSVYAKMFCMEHLAKPFFLVSH